MTRTKQIVLSAAAILAALGAAQATSTPAAAKDKHVKFGFGFHKPHFHTPYFYTPRVIGVGSGCGWMWRKYLRTGNPFWKHSYFECIG
jgi:hypothetical protein